MTRRLTLLIALCLLAAACAGSAPPVPRDHYYRVLVSGPESGPGRPGLPGVLSVPPLDTRGLLRERPLLYVDASQPLEMRQYEYHFWSEPLSLLLQDQLVTYLRGGGIADSVIPSTARVPPDFQLVGRVNRVEQRRGGPAPGILVELELGVVRLADDKLVTLKAYRLERAARDQTVIAAVEAMNGAFGEIFEAFLADTRLTSLALKDDAR